jgi:hypothetical protein
MRLGDYTMTEFAPEDRVTSAMPSGNDNKEIKNIISIPRVEDEVITNITNNKKHCVTTKRKIGKITYVVESSSSETATDTLKDKIENLILRECERLTK